MWSRRTSELCVPPYSSLLLVVQAFCVAYENSEITTHSHPDTFPSSLRQKRKTKTKIHEGSESLLKVTISPFLEKLHASYAFQVAETCPECGHTEAYSKEIQVHTLRFGGPRMSSNLFLRCAVLTRDPPFCTLYVFELSVIVFPHLAPLSSVSNANTDGGLTTNPAHTIHDVLGMVLQVQLIFRAVLHVHAHGTKERHNTKTTQCASYDRYHGLACRNCRFW